MYTETVSTTITINFSKKKRLWNTNFVLVNEFSLEKNSIVIRRQYRFRLYHLFFFFFLLLLLLLLYPLWPVPVFGVIHLTDVYPTLVGEGPRRNFPRVWSKTGKLSCARRERGWERKRDTKLIMHAGQMEMPRRKLAYKLCAFTAAEREGR